MSILDIGLSHTDSGAMQVVAQMVDDVLSAPELANDDFVKLMRSGYALRDIYGLTDDEMEALFDAGCRALKVGQLDQAEETFKRLVQLDALDERFSYALGAVLQLKGAFGPAAKAYLAALALNATRVDVYVRLGECLIAVGEYPEARDMLSIAVELSGSGDDEGRSRAQTLLARVDSLHGAEV